MGSTISAVMGSTLETGKCLASHSSFRGLQQYKGKAFRSTVPIPRACGYSEEASLEFPPPKICKPTRSTLNIWFHTQKAGFSLTTLNHPNTNTSLPFLPNLPQPVAFPKPLPWLFGGADVAGGGLQPLLIPQLGSAPQLAPSHRVLTLERGEPPITACTPPGHAPKGHVMTGYLPLASGVKYKPPLP